MELRISAVSYTHLDVYKRQTLFSGDGVNIEMMSPLEYHAMIKQEYEARRSEVIRLCGELSASAIEEGAKQ